MRSAVDNPVVVGIGEVLWDLLPQGRQLGGAPANFAYHVHCLGARAVLATSIGDDAEGRDILRQLEAAGLDTEYVSIDGAHATGTVSVQLDSAGLPTYTIHERVAWDFIPTSPALLELARGADAVCFGTLAQRSPVSRATIQGFLDATRPGCLSVFDANLRQHYFEAPIVERLLERSRAVKLNDDELPRLVEMLRLPGETAAEWLRALVRQFDLVAAALTRGARGSLLLSGDAVSDHPGVPPERIIDTVGAGDAFTAAFVVGLLRGESLDRINDRANRLAAHVCARPGAMPPVDARYKAILNG